MENNPFKRCDFAACPYCHESGDIIVTESDMMLFAVRPNGTASMAVPLESIYRARCQNCEKIIYPIMIPGDFIRFRFAPMEDHEINEFLSSLAY